MAPDVIRHFTAPDGRLWRVAEFFATHFVRGIAIEQGQRDARIPLLFVAGNDRRWVCSAPPDWADARIEVLVELLERAQPMPVIAWSMGGLSDG